MFWSQIIDNKMDGVKTIQKWSQKNLPILFFFMLTDWTWVKNLKLE